MQSFQDVVDEISRSLVSLDADRLEESLLALEQHGDQLSIGADHSQPPTRAEREVAEACLGKLRAILAESERNLKVLQNLHRHSLNPLFQPVASISGQTWGE